MEKAGTLVAITGRDCSQLIAKLQALLQKVKVQLWSRCTDYEAVEFRRAEGMRPLIYGLS